ncbi:hypothetical protein GCE86_15410 [Micromonospora terminaliae]|uniref:Uncharacterized protein n=1 Tax=Micromonospora terminaliae TaxID=1914461 RepID=A0AAJ3DIB2_9ACTN|nr:hypothetical protein [Micromonospora terminaliae]NES26928.1 hypothetical protein [Micromonospora terminaliae]QGL48289.1 hypothetical protein GCE86_15410 [Micromonospora terminaliae]
MFELVYELLLILGGIAMVAIGIAIKEQSTGSRILNVVVGLAFFGYGFYLMFLAPVGYEYRIFIYVFILPILLIVRAVKARKEAREQAAAHQFAGAAQPGQFAPSASGQPGQGWPAPQGQPYGQAPQGQPYGQAPQQPGHPAPQAPYGQPSPQGQYGQPGPQGQYGQSQGQPYPGA